MANIHLTTDIGGVTFKNPVAASSGTITRSIHSIRECVKAGVGAVVTKSIALVHDPKRMRLPRPSNWFLDKYGDPGGLATIEIGNLPAEQGVEFIEQIKPITKAEGVVLIANMGLIGDLEEFTEEEALGRITELAKRFEAAGADMIEVQRACPVDVGREVVDWSKLSQADYIEKVVRTLKAAISIPFYVKVIPDVVFANFKRFEDAGVDADYLFPLLPGTVIDIEIGKPITPFSLPYYGPSTRAHQNVQVARLASVAKRPIIASGGTMNSRDVIERLMCGATNIQIQTAAMRYGSKVFTEMIDGLKTFMARKGYGSLKDIIGIAVPHINNMEEFAQFVEERQVPREAMTMTIDKIRCTGCGQCDVCPYGAMTMQAGFPKWNSRTCEFCGICQSICPEDVISIRPKAPYTRGRHEG